MIVTALVNIFNPRGIETYINCGKKLLNVDTEKIVFIEENIFLEYLSDESFPKTRFVFFEKHDNYLTHLDTPNFKVITINPQKDTLEYMQIQCHKTEWLKMAMDISDHDQYTWIDFGIYHMINDEDILNADVISIASKSYDKVRSAGCAVNKIIPDITKRLFWFFAGSVIGGSRKALTEFAALTRQKCETLINDKGILMWEINVWFTIFIEQPHKFSMYRSNHDTTIMKGY